ncbi:MAG: hypothetical protein P8J55_05475 [Pseudomonadales bacterium]|nr:hypothetical protein [Pseudomonadales bacterium]
MEDESNNPVHWSFWVIGAIALIWNIMGAINFFMQMNPDILAAYRDSERAIVEGRPLWATVGFAVGVFGGSAGILLLLLRKLVAFYVLIVSLIGVLVTMVHTLGIGIDFGLGEMLGIVLMPVVVAAFLVWYSKWAEWKGWVRSRRQS